MPDSVLPLSVYLFGSPSLWVQGSPARPLRTRKGYALFALLALRSGRAVERDFLAGVLWPESAPEQARAGLRRALTDLRDALGTKASCIASPTARTLQINIPEAAVDVLHFDALLSHANGQAEPRRQAVELYRGPLLEDCSEEWALQERRTRETALYETLHWLARDAYRTGDLNAATGYLKRALAIDPLDERTCRALMQAQFDSGSPALMIETYRNLRTFLRQEVNTEPSPETTELFHRLRKTSARPVHQESVVSQTASLIPTPMPPPLLSYLPSFLTSFVGRERSLEDIANHFPETRLLTLTGTGGVGKTRLAVEVGKRITSFPDGVRFADLSPLQEGSLLPQTLAKALHLFEMPGKELTTMLIERLQSCAMLLILDNCEHLIAAVADLTSILLASCPHLCILATSRQPLHLSGETVWQVPPLMVPDLTVPTGLTGVALSEAVQLFAARARQVNSTFDLTEQNALLVADICRHLDGLPLTIELAAARLNVLSLMGIVDHLDKRLHLLTNTIAAVQPRQRTLRSMLDWSYDLLTEEERQLLRRFSVFASPADCQRIHEVCADLWCEPWQTLLTLASLVEKSLIVFDGENYRLLETVRQYAQEHLVRSGESEGVQSRHRHSFLMLTETAEKHLKGPDAPLWGSRLDRVYDDLRVALDLCPSGDAEIATRLAMALTPYWLLRGHLSEGRRRLSDIRARYGQNQAISPSTWIHLLNGLGTLTYRQGDYTDAEKFLQEKLRICRTQGDSTNTANTLGNLGNIAFYRGDLDTAAREYSECLELLRNQANRQGVATALMNLGNVATMREDYVTAEPLLSESLEIWRELQNIQGIANTLHNLGSVATKQEQYRLAHSLLTECLAVRRQLNHRQGIAHTLLNLQGVCTQTNDLAQARSYLQEAWEILTEIGDRLGQAEALRGAAEILVAEEEKHQGVILYAAMAAQRESIGAVAVHCNEKVILDELETVLGSETFAVAWTIGRCSSVNQLIAKIVVAN
jgi:predicted ATPase/DNA-binding SARP family transcriptional activator